MIKNIKNNLKKNKKIVKFYENSIICFYKFLTILSPTVNTKILYKKRFGRKINLKNPSTLNEKILKMKLEGYENDKLIHQCADKYAVRDYVKQCDCEKLLIPMIASYDKVKDINWDKLPNSFVMKWNFGCSFNIICPDKSKLDKDKTLKQMKKWGRKEYYLTYSEMQYKNVDKKIIVEEFLQPNGKALPDDFKFYCFDGIVKYILVCTDRHSNDGHVSANYVYYDRDWNVCPFSTYALENDCNIDYKRPTNLDTAIEYAEKLSKPFKFVRTDLYICENEIYFGELTFTPAGGMDTDIYDGDKIMGELLKI